MALFLPLAAALVLSFFVSGLTDARELSNQARTAVLMSGIAMVSWLLGLRWYGLKGLGLRGGRPLYAGIGFASLAWVILLLLRIVFLPISPEALGDSLRNYVYLLLFEAFAAQLWSFGILFRTVADWRGPLAAAFSGGLIFGLTATLLFVESFGDLVFSFIFFISWGLLYGIIRLRTGSILGMVLIQSLQSFSAWIVLPLAPSVETRQLQTFYLFTTIAYLVLIWRLWPREEDDYRI